MNQLGRLSLTSGVLRALFSLAELVHTSLKPLTLPVLVHKIGQPLSRESAKRGVAGGEVAAQQTADQDHPDCVRHRVWDSLN